MQFYKLLVLFSPLFLYVAIYASFILASPIPNDTNSAFLYIFALTETPNLLSYLIKLTFNFQPSLMIFLLSTLNVSSLYIAVLFLLRKAKIGFIENLFALTAFMFFPFLIFAIMEGLLVLLLPAGIVGLALAIAFEGSVKRIAIASVLIAFSSFIDPSYSLISALIAILWSFYDRGKILNYAMLANASFFIGLTGFGMTNKIESNIPILRQEPVFYSLLAIVVVLGIYFSWRKNKDLTFKATIWIIASAFLSNFISMLIFITPPLLLLISYMGNFSMRDLFRRESKEIDVNKLLALFIIFSFLISGISNSGNIITNIKKESIDVDSIMDVANFLKDKNAKILAPLDLLPWISKYSGLKPVTKDQKLLDAWSQTAFRIQSKFLRIDDWEPFSSSRAPRLAIYDGSEFKYLLYIDDSYVRFTLNNEKEEWIESPYNMTFLGYKISNTSLQMSFQSKWIRIDKNLTVSGNIAMISYSFNTSNAKVKYVNLFFFAEWPYNLNGYRAEGEKVFVASGNNWFGLESSKNSTIIFDEEIKAIKFIKDFNSKNGTIYLIIKAYDAKESNIEPYATTIFDLLKSKDEIYLVEKENIPNRFSNVANFPYLFDVIKQVYQAGDLHVYKFFISSREDGAKESDI